MPEEQRTFEQITEDITASIAGMRSELGQLPDGDAVRAMIAESLEPFRAELDTLTSSRARAIAAMGSNRSQRDALLGGTRYARLEDPVTGRAWGANEVELLHDLCEFGRARGYGSGPSEQLRNLHADVSARAMDTQESGYGSELVGVGYVGEIWRVAREISRLFALVRSFEMTYPTMYIPVDGAPPEMFRMPESVSADEAGPNTVKVASNRVSGTAQKFTIQMVFSREMEEDSIIPYVNWLMAQAQRSVGYYLDSLLLNGDTTVAATGNINLDDGTPPALAHYTAFDGIRHVGLVDNADATTGNVINQAGAVSWNALHGMRSKMLDRTHHMDWGHPNDPSQLVYVTCPVVGDEITQLDEHITMDKFGQLASVLTGQVGRIGMNPLLTTIAMPLTEDDGKVSATASQNTKGQVATFNTNGYGVGWMRRVEFDSEKLLRTDQMLLVWLLRAAVVRYTPTGAASGMEHACVMRNITLPNL